MFVSICDLPELHPSKINEGRDFVLLTILFSAPRTLLTSHTVGIHQILKEWIDISINKLSEGNTFGEKSPMVKQGRNIYHNNIIESPNKTL